jgi:glycosyltransferase involved in cell wall biosynthesis
MLTVLMPAVMVDEFFKEAIESLRNQTFGDFICLILVPSLSTDQLEMIDQICQGDGRFRIHSLKLGGITFALNYGLNLVETEFVARMDADDVCHPQRFEKQIEFLASNPNYATVGCAVRLIDGNGKPLKQRFRFYEDDHEIRKALKYRMPLCHPALIFRTDVLLLNKGYMYGNTAEDHELYLRIARNPNVRFKNLPEELFSYRKHNSQLTDIKNARSAYYNMAGFMFTEFLVTKNPLFLFGMFASHPSMRVIRQSFRSLRQIFG